MYKKANPFFARQKEDFPGAGIGSPRGSHVISVGKRHLGRELQSGFTGMGNFHNEFSEQGLLLADPITNPSSPYCTSLSLSLSLPLSHIGSSSVMICASLLAFVGKYCFGAT